MPTSVNKNEDNQKFSTEIRTAKAKAKQNRGQQQPQSKRRTQTLNLTITSPTLQFMYTWQCCESLVVHPYNLTNLKYSDYFVLNLFINHL